MQRLEVANDRYTEDNILEEVLTADAERISATVALTDKNEFKKAVDAIMNANKIYVMGMRSSFSLAEFLDYNLSLIFPNVSLVKTPAAARYSSIS